MRNPGAAPRWILYFFIFLCISACSEPDKSREVANTAASPAQLVARVGEREITAAELDEALKLELHDLALAEYELRLGKLSELLRQGKGAVEVYLPAPQPPRIELPENIRTPRGNPDALITIAVFCSYQSPHCKAIQPALRRLAAEYAGWVKQVVYDLPLKFHREGLPAAMAVRCSEEQKALWNYQDGLYAYAGSLNDAVYRQLAAQAGLDLSVFSRCMQAASYRDQINSDVAFASDLGLRNVPVVFINGLYIKGPREYGHYAMWVERELRHLGVPKGQRHTWAAQRRPGKDLPTTELPLALVGVSLSDKVDSSSALIEIEESRARNFSLGSEILPGVLLREIHRSFVVLDNRGEREKLPLKGDASARVPLTASGERDEETLRRIEQPLGEGSRRLVEPSGVLPLGREWLERQLQNRAALEKKFVEAEMAVEGHQLLRLEGIADSEFFTALGFEENDVLLRVNDSWVHSGQNNLWQALTSGQVVDVAFMRNGLPQRLQYIVEERGYFEEAGEGESDNSEQDDSD